MSSRENWKSLETFLNVMTWGWDATGILWVEPREAAKHPIMHRTTQRYYLAQDNSSAKVEKPSFSTPGRKDVIWELECLNSDSLLLVLYF